MWVQRCIDSVATRCSPCLEKLLLTTYLQMRCYFFIHMTLCLLIENMLFPATDIQRFPKAYCTWGCSVSRVCTYSVMKSQSLFFKTCTLFWAICCLKMFSFFFFFFFNWQRSAWSVIWWGMCAPLGTLSHSEKHLWLPALTWAGKEMNRWERKGGKWGNSLRALAISYTVCCSYLYRNIFH